MMVAIAAQRNQKRAAGAITLVIAGFSASGILGIDGVCTKLKYQSRPIHITPLVTCSQRIANSHQPCSPSATLPPRPARMISTTMSSTTPAVIVLPRDWKKAPIVFSFCLWVHERKKSSTFRAMLAAVPRLAANVSMLFPELDFPERFAAARAAGFRYVEYQFPYAWSADEVARRAGTGTRRS